MDNFIIIDLTSNLIYLYAISVAIILIAFILILATLFKKIDLKYALFINIFLILEVMATLYFDGILLDNAIKVNIYFSWITLAITSISLIINVVMVFKKEGVDKITDLF